MPQATLLKFPINVVSSAYIIVCSTLLNLAMSFIYTVEPVLGDHPSAQQKRSLKTGGLS